MTVPLSVISIRITPSESLVIVAPMGGIGDILMDSSASAKPTSKTKAEMMENTFIGEFFYIASDLAVNS